MRSINIRGQVTADVLDDPLVDPHFGLAQPAMRRRLGHNCAGWVTFAIERRSRPPKVDLVLAGTLR
jgi:hypothetical protein